MILILCGPTASGKSTTQKVLCEKYGFNKVVTYTTREPRENEVFGEDYYFVTEDKLTRNLLSLLYIQITATTELRLVQLKMQIRKIM